VTQGKQGKQSSRQGKPFDSLRASHGKPRAEYEHEILYRWRKEAFGFGEILRLHPSVRKGGARRGPRFSGSSLRTSILVGFSF
jgi:hypothetical protein